MRQVVESAEFRRRADEQGAKAVAMRPPNWPKLGENERAMWERIVRLAQIKAD